MSMIQGIPFFDNPSSCIAHFTEAPWTEKVQSCVTSYTTLARFAKQKIATILQSSEPEISDHRAGQGFAKKRLIVCIHGLNSNPSQFNTIIDQLQKKNLSETDIYIPAVLERGNARLDDMAKPIFDEIAKWAKLMGAKELVLVGISNGARIARAVEVALLQSENRGNIQKMRVISIVGASRGSTLANLANSLSLCWVMSEPISREMPTDSERSVKLHQDWTAALNHAPELKRDYTFFASPHDWQVPNFNATLSEVAHHKARYALVRGHGHNSIVDAVASAVAEIIDN